MKAADSFYKSARWQRLRAMVLRRDGYQCQVTKRYGRRVEATTVHHVFPREEFPEYQWEPWNLISLAGDVHDEMHDRQSGALTAKGVELLKRVARREGVKVPLRYRYAPRVRFFCQKIPVTGVARLFYTRAVFG